MKPAVVHLSYIPFGTDHLKRFLESYQINEAGLEHELIILFNGYRSKTETVPFQKILEQSGINYTFYFTKARFDISAYFEIAKKLEHPYLVFLNTHSQILHNNWLLHFYTHLQKENVGAVGATGSWGNKERDENYRNLQSAIGSYFSWKALKEIIKYKFNFYPEVSAHLRTNAFMVKRDTFLSMQYQLFKPWIFNVLHMFKESKFTTECFEHGNQCFTNQIENLGMQVLIVDKNGRGYAKKDWMESNTFWRYDQENLLIADNQTLKYTQGNDKEKKRLNFFAWGVPNQTY